ncbi:MAG: class I SAM-dependent methyltransferase [Phycisphaerales bacterium]|nr:class I SAM-dependent methyltransferase [Phycisphaerales bacterium]
MSDTSAPAHPRRRHPNTAADPATLSREAYVRLQLDRSREMKHEDCSFRARSLLDRLAGAIGPAAFGGLRSILCVGCRNKHELDTAAALGFAEVVGIDLHSLDPRILVMDMHEMSFADGRFDVVLACHSLEHAKDPERAASELRRVAKPGGYIIVEVPIYYGTRGADLWDFESPERVVQLLGDVRALIAEEGPQLDGPQEVARVFAQVPATDA